MISNRFRTAVIASLAGSAFLVSVGVASAQTATTTPAATSKASKPARTPETLLTGAIADQVKAAALVAVPGGTVIRVENDNDGAVYEAHVKKADGTEVEVKFDAAVKVTSIDAHNGPGGSGARGGRGGRGGHGGRDRGATTPTTVKTA